ncbi:unnamed protein product [Cylicocyclus nassatus]|uniref:TIL domain-containing protein n=1 Tax=Cylicocyclus nassatus TaxID=53992 RepID=A0AA36H4L7_CYLNA|nr:unnamed protein product [Cylicocyclus nassatus]
MFTSANHAKSILVSSHYICQFTVVKNEIFIGYEDKKPNRLGILSPPAKETLECKKNETSGCQPCVAEKTCQASPEDTVSSCKTECKVTCVCLNTHVRGPEGNCILRAECPKQ